MTTDGPSPADASRLYERHLDLLLAEEFACNDAFLTWFIGRCNIGGVPDVGTAQVDVVISHHDTVPGQPSADGENDLFIDVTFADGTRLVALIENKIDAGLQQSQLDRYTARAAKHAENADFVAVALVAPSGYVNKLGPLPAGVVAVSVDEVSDFFAGKAAGSTGEDARRSHWKAAQFRGLERQGRRPSADHQPTLELRAWIIDQLTSFVPGIAPRPTSMRARAGTWLSFDEPSAVWFKIGNGIVDIDPTAMCPGDAAAQEQLLESLPHLFALTTDSSGNRVVRYGNGTRRAIDELWWDGSPVDGKWLSDMVRMCAAAVLWVWHRPLAVLWTNNPDTELDIACWNCRQYVGTVTSFDPRQDLMSSVFSPNVRAVASEHPGYRYPTYGAVACSCGHTMDWSPQFFDPTVYYFENQATRGFQVSRQQMTVRTSRAGRAGRPGERPDRFPHEPAPHSSP